MLRIYAALLHEATRSWGAHRASSMGASLAFYTLFSLAPMLVIAIALAGLVFGVDAVRGDVVGQIGGLIGKPGAEAIQGLIAGARDPLLGFWATMLASVTLLVVATTAFAELKASLDVIWGVKPVESGGLTAMLHGRLLSFGLILTLGFLLLVSLVVSAVVVALQRYWGDGPAGAAWLTEVINSIISFGVASALFAFIYKWLPEPSVAWRDVAVGALVTSVLFTLGKFLIGLYLGNSAIASSFGAAGSLMVILVWVYYSSQIFLFGAEFTRVYAESRGSRS